MNDLSIHDSVAVFAAILIARHCFALEDVVEHVALTSLLVATPSLTGEFLLRFINPSILGILSPLLDTKFAKALLSFVCFFYTVNWRLTLLVTLRLYFKYKSVRLMCWALIKLLTIIDIIFLLSSTTGSSRSHHFF